jgi:single-strand DNA-binding protein
MSDTFVTFHGWVGGEVIYRNPQGISVVNFRVGSTPRVRRDGKWCDGDTTWYSVNGWRGLADNIRASVKKGDAVIVHGRLRSENWVRDDHQLSTTLVVEASFVGHDLTRGTSEFVKSPKPERPENNVDEEVQDMMQQQTEEPTQIDPWGNPKGTVDDQGKAA